MENNLEKMLINKLKKLNEIEQNKSRVLTAIFIKTANELKNQKIKAMQDNILNQADFYNQDINKYDKFYNEVMNKYTNQLSQIINIYTELFINIQMELQEAECNQKIAITNVKKSIDMKNSLSESSPIEIIENYRKKIDACMQKKYNYDIIIENCEKELEQCSEKMIAHINLLFGDKSSQVSLRNEEGFMKYINKFINRFTGANKFNTYVITPTNIEVETRDNNLPILSGEIKDKTIDFVAKIKQAKDETNKIFDKMIV